MKSIRIILSLLLVFASFVSTMPGALASEFRKAQCVEEETLSLVSKVGRPAHDAEDEDSSGGRSYSATGGWGGFSPYGLSILIDRSGDNSLFESFAFSIPLFLLFQKLVFYF